MTLRLWLEISADTCRERRAADIGHVRAISPGLNLRLSLTSPSLHVLVCRHQGPVSPETFREALWPRHLEYKRAVSPDASPDVHVLDGEQTPDAMLVRALPSRGRGRGQGR